MDRRVFPRNELSRRLGSNQVEVCPKWPVCFIVDQTYEHAWRTPRFTFLMNFGQHSLESRVDEERLRCLGMRLEVDGIYRTCCLFIMID
jgi:hypothetical protein